MTVSHLMARKHVITGDGRQVAVSISPGRTRIKREFRHSAICNKGMKREEMKVTSNIPQLAVIVFSGLEGGDESHDYGGEEVFVGGSRLRTTVASL